MKVGHQVSLQNLAGNKPLKWDRTGIVVEVMQNDQYKIKVDGSNRVTLRNRKHLRIIGFIKPCEPFATTVIPKSRGEEEISIEVPTVRPTKEPTQVLEKLKPAPATPVRITDTTMQTPKKAVATSPEASPKFYTPIGSTPRSSQMPMMQTPMKTMPSSPGTPIRTSVPIPRKISVEVKPTIHRELRSFNKPGAKETAPLMSKHPDRQDQELGIQRIESTAAVD